MRMTNSLKTNKWWITLVVCLAALNHFYQLVPLPFISCYWKRYPVLRYAMHWDLEWGHKLEGKSREQVIELLGAPTDTAGTHQEWLEYWCTPVGSDSQTRYDVEIKNGIVHKCNLYRDG